MSSKKGGNEKNVEYDVFPPEESHKIFIKSFPTFLYPRGMVHLKTMTIYAVFEEEKMCP